MVLLGTGLGLTTAPATEAIMGSLSPDKAGVGSAVNDTTRELGGTLGVAIVGSVFASIYSGRIASASAVTALPKARRPLPRRPPRGVPRVCRHRNRGGGCGRRAVARARTAGQSRACTRGRILK